jgi:DNA-binding response OmpR family regulator
MNKQRLLIVDDDIETLKLLQLIFMKYYHVNIADNGVDALEIVSIQKPDLILMDILMPDLDGYEVCRRIKADQSTKDIPVIFITGLLEADKMIKGFEVGGIDYLIKPLNTDVAIARIKAHMAHKREKELLKENIRLREDVERITRHDLKSPLSLIFSVPGMMKKENNLTEEQIDLLDNMSLASHKLLDMINLSLDLHKMEQGSYTIFPMSVDIIAILNDILFENRRSIESSNITVLIYVDQKPVNQGADFKITGEPFLIYTMLSNLFKNALEASPENETITISMETNPLPTIEIHNQGAVPEEIRDTFFEKYVTSGKKSANGLGTYSSQLIMKTMGGGITMETSQENGTRLRIIFPQII